MFEFNTLNYTPVLVAAVVSFLLGALWYSPFLFGKIWQKEVSFDEQKTTSTSMFIAFGGSFVMMLIMILGLAAVIQEFSYSTKVNWQNGALIGLFMGLFFVFTSTAINYLYQRKSLKLFFIDSGYQVLFLFLSGIIIGIWPDLFI